MILNSNRLRTFEGARLEIVSYVEAKFGLRNRDSKPSDTGSRGHSDTVDVDAVDPLVKQRRRVTRSARKGVSSAVEHFFNETAMQARTPASNRLATGKQSKSWSKSEGKGKSKENKGKSEGQSKGPKGAKGSCKGKTSKNGYLWS